MQNDIAKQDSHYGKTYAEHLAATRAQTLQKWLSTWQDLTSLTPPKNGWGKEGAAVGANGLLEWSVLDAQWFGLAQRRKRVFAIVDFGDWSSRPPILLERESLRGDTPPSREARQDFTADVTSGTTSESLYIFVEPSRARALDVLTDKDPIPTLQANMGTGGNNMPLLCINEAIAIQGNMIGRKPENGPQGSGHDKEVCFTLTSADRHAVACGFKAGQGARAGGIGYQEDLSPTLTSANSGSNMVPTILCPPSVVRRLTPIECERLQGFPDNFTQIPYRNKSADDCPNSPRYKALGNSMAVNVMAWIGQKIQQTQGVKVYGAKTL